MFEALGGRVPTFAHLPLLTGKEGKLSKRLGSLGVSELRAEGIEPMAVSSFLAKLGTSEAIEPFYDLETLAATLDFAKIGRAQPKFDEEELKHFNVKLVHGLDYDRVAGRVDVDEQFWNAVRPNLERVADVKIWTDICRREVIPVIEDDALLKTELLPPEPWNQETWTLWINQVREKSGKKGRELFHPIRKALTAQENGPELKILLPLIGREKVLSRLQGIAA